MWGIYDGVGEGDVVKGESCGKKSGIISCCVCCLRVGVEIRCWEVCCGGVF